MTATAIVLAAGKGTRMRSDLPKVLHRLHGKPLVHYPVAAARAAGATAIVVVIGHGAQQVRDVLPEPDVRFAVQAEQNGTGHAVLCAVPELPEGDGPVLVLSGDVPMLRAQTLQALIEAWRSSSAGMAVAVFRPDDPTGYGRMVRDAAGNITRIVEHRDATEAQRALGECNSGTYCISAVHLREVLPTLGRANTQGEVYLTDLVQRCAESGTVVGLEIAPREAAGINTREQLAALEAETKD